MTLYVSATLIFAIVAIYYHLSGVELPLISHLGTRRVRAAEKVVLGALAISLSLVLVAVVIVVPANPNTTPLFVFSAALAAFLFGVERLVSASKTKGRQRDRNASVISDNDSNDNDGTSEGASEERRPNQNERYQIGDSPINVNTWSFYLLLIVIWGSTLEGVTMGSASVRERSIEAIPFLLPITVLIIWWLSTFKKVFLEGRSILISNGKKEISVPSSALGHINDYPLNRRMSFVTLVFDSKTEFGRSIRVWVGWSGDMGDVMRELNNAIERS